MSVVRGARSIRDASRRGLMGKLKTGAAGLVVDLRYLPLKTTFRAAALAALLCASAVQYLSFWLLTTRVHSTADTDHGQFV